MTTTPQIIQSTLFNNREPSEIRHAAITCGIVATTSLISLVTDKLGLLLEVSSVLMKTLNVYYQDGLFIDLLKSSSV